MCHANIRRSSSSSRYALGSSRSPSRDAWADDMTEMFDFTTPALATPPPLPEQPTNGAAARHWKFRPWNRSSGFATPKRKPPETAPAAFLLPESSGQPKLRFYREAGFAAFFGFRRAAMTACPICLGVSLPAQIRSANLAFGKHAFDRLQQGCAKFELRRDDPASSRLTRSWRWDWKYLCPRCRAPSRGSPGTGSDNVLRG